MRYGLAVVLFFLWMGVPAWAVDAMSFDSEQPFKEVLSKHLLRSFLNQALDHLKDHVEISGDVIPDKTTNDREGHLRLKFYPEGEAKSDQPFTAEGRFRLAPDGSVRDFSLRFMNPDAPAGNVPRQSDRIL